ncbi:MAG TPA: NAD-dependent 4,6-dehydratase LegB [Oligoflexia bacterium]|nr:NAD-dependent 4,6-dehydratase LegB [Oligoflexia bacterium]
MKKKILVTGADGFIGSHLTEALVKEGYDVRAFVLYNSFNSWGWLDTLDRKILDQIDVFSGDIRDPNGVQRASQGRDIVLHLAALIGIPYSYHSPTTYVETNVLGTLNIVQAARDHGIKVIHTSTSEVYGTAKFVPMTEDHPLQGQSPYSASKIGADQIALSYYQSFGTEVAVLRPFNTYGPRQSARAVIPTIITQLASGKRDLEIGSLTPTRDFTFVEDTVRGFIAAIHSDAAIGRIINIGSNFEVSIEDTVKIISEIMGKTADISQKKDRTRPEKSEVFRLRCDNTLAKATLGWEPKLAGTTGFRRGLEQTVTWFSNPENLKLFKNHIYNI